MPLCLTETAPFGPFGYVPLAVVASPFGVSPGASLSGSGLFGIVVEPPGPVVVVDEQQQADPVHPVALAEGERLAHEPRQPLPQGVVPTLDMTRLAVALVRRPCPSLRAGSPGSPWRRRPRSP